MASAVEQRSRLYNRRRNLAKRHCVDIETPQSMGLGFDDDRRVGTGSLRRRGRDAFSDRRSDTGADGGSGETDGRPDAGSDRDSHPCGAGGATDDPTATNGRPAPADSSADYAAAHGCADGRSREQDGLG